MAEAESKPKETKAERYVRQMEQIQTLRQQAVEELLEKRREIDDQLKMLGHEPARGGKAGRRRGAATKAQLCDSCNLPGPDKRNPRNQDPPKKFTAEELAQKGLLAK
ncbi:MAG: hypothetical protein NVSMB58_37790 [Terriglobales bacterium]